MQKPSYYAKLAIDPLEYAYKNKLNPYQFNALKYITRYKDKNGIEDLEKALHCIDELRQQFNTNNIMVKNCIDETMQQTYTSNAKFLPDGRKVKEINSLDVKFAINPYEYLYKNKIGEIEANIIICIMFAKHKGALDNLQEARQDLIKLLRIERDRSYIYFKYNLTPEQKLIVENLAVKNRGFASRKFLDSVDSSYKKGDYVRIRCHNKLVFSNNENINVKYGDCIICLKDQNYLSGYKKNNWLHLQWTSKQ